MCVNGCHGKLPRKKLGDSPFSKIERAPWQMPTNEVNVTTALRELDLEAIVVGRDRPYLLQHRVGQKRIVDGA